MFAGAGTVGAGPHPLFLCPPPSPLCSSSEPLEPCEVTFRCWLCLLIVFNLSEVPL